MSYSPKTVSQAIGVSEASLKRWCDQGRLQFSRTPGGHRRISREAVLRFVRENDHQLVAPALLGMPRQAGRPRQTEQLSVDQVLVLLRGGDESGLRLLVSAYCLAKRPLAALFDRVLGPAFKALGCEWEQGRAEVYQERRGCEICRRTIAEILQTLPLPAVTAHRALGGSLAGDPYDLGGVMVEAVLRERGWDAGYLGSDLPVETLVKAIDNLRPRLFWLSISSVRDEPQLIEDCAALYETCLAHQCLLVIGGTALSPERRAQLKYSCYCDNLDQLLNFMNSLERALEQVPPP